VYFVFFVFFRGQFLSIEEKKLTTKSQRKKIETDFP